MNRLGICVSVAFRLCTLQIIVLGLLVLAGCQHRPAHVRAGGFDFVQMCDPQLGFTNYAADLRRLEQAVKQINTLRPELVVVCGDLVNTASEQSFADFNAARARLEVPSHLAAGNHDIGSPPTAQSLERFRRLVGKDYYSVLHKGYRFVIVNSQLWKTPIPGETDKQDAWLGQVLASARKKGEPVFVVMHHPIFLLKADEEDNYFNLPQAKRRELLSLFEQSGVVAVLMGHTHTTFNAEYKGIQMVCSETTSRNFDNHPFGFRLWHVTPQRPYRHEFIPLPTP